LFEKNKNYSSSGKLGLMLKCLPARLNGNTTPYVSAGSVLANLNPQ
jgi:hypothetical protein